MQGWPEIVRQYSPLVKRIACRLLGNGGEAVDCAQEVFLCVIRSFQPHEVRDWPDLLGRLTTCRALDMLRRRTSRATRARKWAETAGTANPELDPLQVAKDRELLDQLREALAQLPPQQAEVFYLVCIEERGHDEVARQLQLTTGHVRVLLHRARTQLRELLAELAESEPD